MKEVGGPAVLKIVVAGGFGVGKTTCVRAVSEIEPLTTEEYLTQASAPTDSLEGVETKDTTTVAFDFGRLSLDVPVPLELFLFGTPGQDRFVDLWFDLSSGAVGAVVLADTRRLASSFTAVSFFEQIDLPFIVAINQFDRAYRYPEHEIRQALSLGRRIPVVACDARVPSSVAGVLLTLVDHALSSSPADPARPPDQHRPPGCLMTHHTHTPLPPTFTGPNPHLLPARADRDVIVPPPGAVRLGSGTVTGDQAQEFAEQTARGDLIQRLHVPTGPHTFFDGLAAEMATATGFLYGMVSLFLAEQTFVGLHNPPPDSGHLIVGRTMSRDHGWCPEVVKRKKALPLPNVHASPRFSGNHVVDAVGIQSYFGAPLLHAETGIVLGTVCVIDPDTRPLSDARRLRDVVLATSDTVMKAITAGASTY
ncbi:MULTISPECIES: ATP/GTP-binding protein [unclassified Streptomyces]|uniref:ATP/GTP-binding protein n=1 Tax=unclassified Streptomyces TaxID=2593676 RepID=UPI00386D3E20